MSYLKRIQINITVNGLRAVALVDSGATRNVISASYVAEHGLKTEIKQHIPELYSFDGTKVKGDISRELKSVVRLGGRSFNITFDVVAYARDVFLGYPWLKEHNPLVDWAERTITWRKPKPVEKKAGIRKKNKAQPAHIVGATWVQLKDTVAATEEIPSKYSDYQEIFENPEEGIPLPKHKAWDHAIDLEPGAQLNSGPIYPLSKIENETSRTYIEKQKSKGYIQSSTSPAGYPILFVKKSDGSLRPCMDYRKLNAVTVKNKYPIPLCEELFGEISRARWYTQLDLRDAFNLIRVREGDEWKTAFRTRYGLFEYKVMPFGLTNAPATFQKVINEVLGEYLNMFVTAYLDDILIYSDNEKDHEQHVKKVLGKLKEAELRVKLEKSRFHTQQVKFLGFIIKYGQIQMDKEETKAVEDWPKPEKVKDIQAFLGFANFYRNLIRSFSKITKPLNDLLKKGVSWKWEKTHQQAFEHLKQKFTEEPVLTTFDDTKRATIEVDASDYAMGACLLQEDKPIAYFSKTFQSAEINYDVGDKELLAVVSALQNWRIHLEGAVQKTRILSDHDNLTKFTTTKELNRRQARWSEKLASYNFEIEHVPGSRNRRADALNRRPDYKVPPKEKKPLLRWKNNRLELAELPTPETVSDKQKFRNNYSPEELGLVKGATGDFYEKTGVLYFQDNIFVPKYYEKDVIRENHDELLAGHKGINATWIRVSEKYFFPKMREKIKKHIRECVVCAKTKKSRQPGVPLLPLSVPDSPWESIAMDFITDLPESLDPITGIYYQGILVIVDRFSKAAKFVPVKNKQTAEDLAHLIIKELIATEGVPKSIVSDRDKLFISKFWTALMTRLGTQKKMSTAFHPQTDGQTEWLNQTLEQYLRAYINEEQDNWVELSSTAQLVYNNTPTETTGLSPKDVRDLLTT